MDRFAAERTSRGDRPRSRRVDVRWVGSEPADVGEAHPFQISEEQCNHFISRWVRQSQTELLRPMFVSRKKSAEDVGLGECQ